MLFFFFNDTATTEIYTLSLHDALPIYLNGTPNGQFAHEPEPIAQNLTGLADEVRRQRAGVGFAQDPDADRRSEEHTSELQSRQYLVCRLLLEKKKHIK